MRKFIILLFILPLIVGCSTNSIKNTESIEFEESLESVESSEQGESIDFEALVTIDIN